jgi:hypothetical protein
MNAKEFYDKAFADPGYNSEGIDSPRFQFAMKHLTSAYHTIADVGSGRGGLRNALGKNADCCISFDLENYSKTPWFFGVDLTNSEDRVDLAKKLAACNAVVCLDVLEHLPEADAEAVVIALTSSPLIFDEKKYILSVSNNVEPAHLTVKPLDWWRGLFKRYMRIEAEEVHNNGQTLCVAGTPL